MVFPVTHWHFFGPTVLLCGLLAGCGGGSSGGATSSTTDSTTTTTTPTPTPTTPGTTAVQLGSTVITGVVSTGAPVMGASVRVMDASGAEVALLDAAGNRFAAGQSLVQTVVADGSYRINLASASQNLPLLLQVSGVDASGLPLLLHSTLSGSTLPLIANVTPATEAVLALVLGANPRDVWSAATTQVESIKLLGNATVMAAASDLVKTVIKANLTAGKITDTKTLDFFRDGNFVANKTGLDLALEGLRVQIVKAAAGQDQLQLSNKFASRAAPEVKMDLATAKTELGKATGGVVANAIVSTAKATTHPAIVAINATGAANLALLDDVTAKLNQLIAQSSPPSSSATFDASAPLAAITIHPATGPDVVYNQVMHNGRTKSQLTDVLAAYTAGNWQLGRLMVTGCVDDPLPSKGCTRVAVSTLVSDQKGVIKGIFSDVAAYIAPVAAIAAKPPAAAVAAIPAQWLLVGNGEPTQFEIFPATYAQYGANGTLVTATTTQPNPISGVLAVFRAVDWSTPPASRIVESLVQVPSNFSVRFSRCDRPQSYLCINPAPSSSAAAAAYSGDRLDTLIKPPYLGWVGSVDTMAGAKYVVSYTMGTTTEPTYTQNAYLNADVPVTPLLAQLPALDAVPTPASLQTGSRLSWAQWAKANRHMKLLGLRVIAKTASSVSGVDFAPTTIDATELVIPSPGITAATGTTYQLLLSSQDNLGRYSFSLITLGN